MFRGGAVIVDKQDKIPPVSDTAFILIVQDGFDQGEAFVEGLRRAGHACHVVHSGDEALASLRRRQPDVIVSADQLGGPVSGLDLLREAKRLSPDTEVILVTRQEAPDHHGGEPRPFAALRMPVSPERLRDAVHRAAHHALANKESRQLRKQLDRAFNFEGIVGCTEIMVSLINKIKRVATSKITVLLMGETGTGKDLLAQALHIHSSRSGKPYRALNCAGLNENLLESELFGHVKGAFTGALADRKGVFEAADSGTLFLDEVGDMPLAMQAKLLRALESGEIVPVGSNDVRNVDVRVIAATHQDLGALIQEGRFRDDLYYRLNQVQLQIPPLRGRRDDVPILVNYFLEQANAERRRAGQPDLSLDPAAMRKLSAYNWPGNVRQLRSTIAGIAVQKEDDFIRVDDLPDAIRGSTQIVPVGPASFAGLSMADVERIHIANTLKLTAGNRERAAKMLGIGARTLYRKLKEYNLT
jgi:two-component system response regulator HydG